jgi:hypothetical protein|tara:strand:+ start:570 stop:815 length:246 start_codon:yes stop_codon:yes gene_type:complete
MILELLNKINDAVASGKSTEALVLLPKAKAEAEKVLKESEELLEEVKLLNEDVKDLQIALENMPKPCSHKCFLCLLKKLIK